MNNNERKEISYFPKALDEAINQRFGSETEAVTWYNFFADTYVTDFLAEGAKRDDINEFIAGYIAGNKELGERLLSLKNTK
jgi:hypothetical protein